MKQLYFIFLLLLTSISFSQNYPPTKKTPQKLVKHGLTYHDDYSWLEKMGSPEVVNWVDAQNDLLKEHLSGIMDKEDASKKITEYANSRPTPFPYKRRHYFYSNYIVKSNLPVVLYYRKKLDDLQPTELVDPFKIYNDKNVVLSGYYPSFNSKILAYTISKAGSDKEEMRFVEIANAKHSDEVIKDVKFSGAQWNGDKGVFYKKNVNLSTFAKDSTYQLYYHATGTTQSNDELIFDTTASEASLAFFTQEDKLFIFEENKEKTYKNYYYASLTSPKINLVKFIEKDNRDIKFLGYRNGKMYYSTVQYGWGEIRSCDIKTISEEKVIVPQIYTYLLEKATFVENHIICIYKAQGRNFLYVYDYNGVFVRKFEAPKGTEFNFEFFNAETREVFVTLHSFAYPITNCVLNLATGDSNPYFNEHLRPKPTLFPLDYFETKLITYKSRDGYDVPITIVHKKGIKLDGNNPALLKAYGGFGVVSRASYDPGLIYFLEKGGVFAFASIRGGGEKGIAWHNKGKGLNKKNSINDFIDAAEFLIQAKYTSPGKLGITGSSHGGLIVGAAMTERPELFKVSIPNVGKFDMLKADDYTISSKLFEELGNAEVKEEFINMMSYSPYHNIKDGVDYPVCMIITSENDDRVAPFHSYKFAAHLQNRVS
ncbi:MAG: S9 family peptidase, partial [Flavobacterium sp.]